MLVRTSLRISVKVCLSILGSFPCIVIDLVFLVVALTIRQHPVAPFPGYKLVWQDEFSNKGLPDPKKWNYEVGFIRNQEKQYYTKERLQNAMVNNGKLRITARQDGFESHDVTSGSITTHGLFDFKYGYVEVRAKVPTGKGTWPAIWMLGSNIDKVGWPMCGEIDIMEYVGMDPDQLHFNIHLKAPGKGTSVTVPKAWEDFHNYGLEWTADYLRLYLDGKQVLEFPKKSDKPEEWPFGDKQYLILNLAIGGEWGGQQGIDASIYPSKFEVDYVRVFQK
jgi:beta-glucanase (GH16 family)